MDHTCYSRVFLTVRRLLTLTESIAEVPNRQVAKSAKSFSAFFLCFCFRDDSATMTEAITMIQTRRSATGSRLLHPHHIVLKQRVSSARGKYMYLPLYTVLFRSVLHIKRWLRLHRKRSLEHELFCLDAYNT